MTRLRPSSGGVNDVTLKVDPPWQWPYGQISLITLSVEASGELYNIAEELGIETAAVVQMLVRERCDKMFSEAVTFYDASNDDES